MSDRPAGLARRADTPGTLALNAEDDLARSATIVQETWPSTMGGLWGHLASFPVNTRRLIHCWKADTSLPEARSLAAPCLMRPLRP